jgi:hypothetical protein
MSHLVYEPDLRHCRGLPARYARFEPELFRVLVDVRQAAGLIEDGRVHQ